MSDDHLTGIWTGAPTARRLESREPVRGYIGTVHNGRRVAEGEWLEAARKNLVEVGEDELDDFEPAKGYVNLGLPGEAATHFAIVAGVIVPLRRADSTTGYTEQTYGSIGATVLQSGS